MGMESIREIYRIGRGPSSSHTMGPERACKLMMSKNIDCDSYKVILYGSLAFTGKGHGTDRVIKETLDKPTEVLFNYDLIKLPHPNTLDIIAIKENTEVSKMRVMSVGGGRIQIEGSNSELEPELYELTTYFDISRFCLEQDINLWQYVEMIEGEEIYQYMVNVWNQMKSTIEAGLKDSGTLPGGLDVQKKAKTLYEKVIPNEDEACKENRLISAYAFSAAEQNAGAFTMVTAPTCGASGVVPAVLYYMQKKKGFSDKEIIHALYVGGLIGNLVKTNASISGAECGCQAEVGTACAMAAAALSELFQYDFDKIEYAAEIAIEHHLGLTCDPIKGLVQIPCIERNAVSAMSAIHACNLANVLSDSRKMSLDDVILVMKQTGLDLNPYYRETSKGGLAKIEEFKKKIKNRKVRMSIINKC